MQRYDNNSISLWSCTATLSINRLRQSNITDNMVGNRMLGLHNTGSSLWSICSNHAIVSRRLVDAVLYNPVDDKAGFSAHGIETWYE